jgi:hypothetical protein
MVVSAGTMRSISIALHFASVVKSQPAVISAVINAIVGLMDASGPANVKYVAMFMQ